MLINVVILHVYVLGFGSGVLGLGRGDRAGVVDVKGCWDGEVEGTKIMEEVSQAVCVLCCVEGGYVFRFPCG